MQQQSSMILFCEECGAANEASYAYCQACQHRLTRSTETLPAPVRVAPPPVRTIVAGAPDPQTLLPGTLLFGRYQLCQEIGRGGFSKVYLAEDLRASRHPVAIKRISLHNLSARQVIDATETANREIQMLSLLKSVKGVPLYYESFTDPENWYLVMEHIPGQTLEEYMQKAPGGHLSESETLRIGRELADILRNLHNYQRQVIFRDVKPSNVMITPEGKLYLIDFGIARFFTPGQKRDTTPLGSPGYAPLEQYGKAQTDPRADIYSLGATLQTLVTGRDPLELAQGEPSYNPKQPSRRLGKQLARMLQPEASLRPTTMDEIKRNLQRLEALPVNIWHMLLSLGVGTGFGLALVLLVIFSFTVHFFPFWYGIGPMISVLTKKRKNQNRKKLFARPLARPFVLLGLLIGGCAALLFWWFFWR